MWNKNTIRLACRTGGVNRVNRVIRMYITREIVCRLHGNAIPVAVQAEQVGRRAGQAGEQLLLSEQDLHLGVGQDKGQALNWIGRVQRHIGASCLENTQ